MEIPKPEAPKFDVIEDSAERLVLENRTARRHLSFPFILLGLPAIIASVFLREIVPYWVGLAGLVFIAVAVLINLLRKRLVFDKRRHVFTVDNKLRNREQFRLTGVAYTEIIEETKAYRERKYHETRRKYYSVFLNIKGRKFEINRDTSKQFIEGIQQHIDFMIRETRETPENL